MLRENLMAIGLSDKESDAYLTLLRSGTQTTSFIAKKADLNRGTAYVALHSLLEKGLVAKSTKNKIQYFTALKPQQLIGFLDRQERSIAEQRTNIQGMMAQFEALVNPHTTKPKIEFFEGTEGARTAFEDTLNSKEKTLRAFLTLADLGEFIGAEFFQYYTTRRIELGYTLHALRTREKDKTAVERNKYARRYMTSKKDNRIVRYVDEDLAFPITMYMYDSKLCMISSKEENFALIIESRELAQMQKKIFGLIWSSISQKEKDTGRV